MGLLKILAWDFKHTYMHDVTKRAHALRYDPRTRIFPLKGVSTLSAKTVFSVVFDCFYIAGLLGKKKYEKGLASTGFTRLLVFIIVFLFFSAFIFKQEASYRQKNMLQRNLGAPYYELKHQYREDFEIDVLRMISVTIARGASKTNSLWSQPSRKHFAVAAEAI